MKKKLSILVVLMFILISTFTFAGYQVDFGYVAGDLNFSNGTIRNFNTLQFNTSGCDGSITEGDVCWNPIDQTLDIVTGDTQVIQVGREMGDIGKNVEGSSILNGAAVYLSGSSGTRAEFKLADASNFSKSSMIGVVTTDCNDNAECPVTTYGLVRNLNTSAYSTGAKLYLSATNPGEYVTTAPGLPNNNVWIGTVIRSHTTEGSIFVDPKIDVSNGVTLHNLGIAENLTVNGNTFNSNDTFWNNEDAYISAGGANQVLFGTNIYQSNGVNVFPGTKEGAFLFINDAENLVYYTHNGSGGFNTIFTVAQSIDKTTFETDISINAQSASALSLRELDIGGETQLKWLDNTGANAFGIIKDAGDELFFYDFLNSAERLRIDNNGYVGIGTSSPNALLEVYDGNIRISSDFPVIEMEERDAARTWKQFTSGGDFYIQDTTAGGNWFYIIGGTGVTYIPTAYSATVGGVNRDVYIDNTGKIGYVSSSERYKTNIQDLNNTNWIYNLRPVSFDYINPEQGINKMGLIAEEVEKINPNIVSYNLLDNGTKQVETVTYSDLVVPLLNELQEANKRITYLEEVLSAKYPEITPKYQTLDNIEYVEQPSFTLPIECRENNIKYCFTEEACITNGGYWNGNKCSELKDDKQCSSTNLIYCITESACINALGVWQDSTCITAEI